MNKRILNAVGWTLLFPALLFAVGGIPGIGFGVSATITVVCAMASITLFWFGGYNRSRCQRPASTE